MNKLLTGLALTFAFILSTGTAVATDTDVIINEFSSNGSSDWVELYNSGTESVDLNGWKIQDQVGPELADIATTTISGVSLPAGGFVSVSITTSGLNGGGDVITLFNAGDVEIDKVSFGSAAGFVVSAPGAGESAYRLVDGGNSWVIGTPTQGASNVPAATIGEIEYSTLHEAVSAASSEGGDVIVLNKDITISSQVTINKSLTLDGNGHTLFAPFAKTDNDNNSAIGIVGVNGAVVVQNLTIDGAGSTGSRHGINVYRSNGVTLSDVTLKNNNAAGLIVNSSTVTANDLNTSENVWYGVNVDKNATEDAVFTLTGNGTIAETTQIKSDKTVGVTVTANGYDEYTVDGTTITIWTNKGVTTGAVIEGTNIIYSTIQAAINAASTTASDTINVGEGTYSENITVSKALTLIGAGESTILSGVVVNANDVTLQDVRIDKGGIGNGIDVIANINNLTLDGVTATNAVNGLRVGSGITIDGLIIDNSHFDGNTFGWYLAKDNASSGDATVTNVLVTDTTFSNNLRKGIYAEKLNNAVFDNITVANSGTDATYNVNNGIDINLKWSAYESITIKNSTVTGSGLQGTNQPFNPAGIAIKGRDDAPSYASPAGTLSGVTLDNVNVSGGVVGVRFGEEGKSNAGPTNVVVKNSSISGTSGVALANESQATTTAAHNWWGTAVESEIVGKVTGKVEFGPWYINASKSVLSNAISGSTLTATDTEDVGVDEGDEGEAVLPTGVTELVLGDSTLLDLSAGAVVNDDKKEVTIQSGTDNTPIVIKNSAVANVSVTIPDNTKISGPTSWDGKIQPPKTETPSGTAPAGFSVGSTVISVGSADGTLTFDKAVKLVLPGVTGTVGYKPAGSSDWVTIGTQCVSATDSSNISSGECYFTLGGDTVIWTYHFTDFGGLNSNPNPAPSSSRTLSQFSGGGGSNVATATVGVGEVLGSFSEEERLALIADIKGQLITLISQLIQRLEAQLAAAQATQN